MSRLGNKIVKWIYDGKKTICLIQEPQKRREDEPNTIVMGEVKKYAKDISDKRVGRKLSFQRAMTLAVETGVISKAERTNIWNDFREQIKQPVVHV